MVNEERPSELVAGVEAVHCPRMPTMPQPMIAIAGGGIGGLAAAVALRQRGCNVVVFERAAALREVGAGLLLTSNAMAVLRALDLEAAARACGYPVGPWRVLDWRGRCRQQITPARAGDPPGLSLHRAELLRVLGEALPAGVLHLGAEVSAFTPRPDGVDVQFANGDVRRVDALIGADGLHSRVRASLWGEAPPVYRGYVGWRAIATADAAVTARGISESWGGGKRFGIAPIGGGRVYWYASANRPSGWRDDPAQRRDALLALFADWHAPVVDLIAATPTANILCSDICDRPALSRWGEGVVTLLGDAAHPMTPNLGQGACTALEDAWTLARCVAEAATITEAFRRYESQRARRLARVQWCSRQLGRVIQLESPAAIAVRDTVLRLTPDALASWTLRPLFSFRP